MLNRTVIVAIVAVVAIAIGVAASFFELIVLGVLAAIVALALTLRDRLAGNTRQR
jgi:hypothetical protein